MIISSISEINKKKFHTIIIGSGPAGMSLALKFEKKKIPVLIIEAGHRYASDSSQVFYKGNVYGDNYPDLSAARLRQLGGSSGHWGGTCSVMTDYDFSKWPIKKNDLDIYESEAKGILNLKGSFIEKEIGDNINYIGILRSDVNFAEKYFSHLSKSSFITLVLDCSFLKFNFANNSINSAEVHFKNNIYKISSKNYVLACGGLENSRLLLWSKSFNKNYFDHDMPIGNYYMDHPTANVGEGILNFKTFFKFLEKENFNYDISSFCNSFIFFSPNKDFIEKNKILTTRIGIYFKTLESKDYKKRIIRKVSCIAPNFVKYYTSDDTRNFTIEIQSDQEPSFENKITLDPDLKDKYGIPNINLFWKRSKLVRESSRIAMIELGKFFVKKNIGRIGVEDFLFSNKEYLHTGGYHHMGGTRIGVSKKDSVVDKNLKVHGINNLYICGSSVFRSGGSANPTFTIVQLSLRLGDHLIEQT
jgi:hypothetical protein